MALSPIDAEPCLAGVGKAAAIEPALVRGVSIQRRVEVYLATDADIHLSPQSAEIGMEWNETDVRCRETRGGIDQPPLHRTFRRGGRAPRGLTGQAFRLPIVPSLEAVHALLEAARHLLAVAALSENKRRSPRDSGFNLAGIQYA